MNPSDSSVFSLSHPSSSFPDISQSSFSVFESTLSTQNSNKPIKLLPLPHNLPSI